MEPSTKPRIMIADDDPEACQLISEIIEDAGCEVVAIASDGDEVLELAVDRAPDIILLDLTMPRVSGLTALSQLRESDQDVAVIIVTAHEDPRMLREAISSGASGYLTKPQLHKHLVGGIATVLTGDFAVAEPGLIQKALQPLRGTARMPDEMSIDSSALKALTPRERTVLSLIAKGYDNQEIADELVISYNTVKSHTNRIFNKLEVTDRTQAALLALRAGLVNTS